MVVIRVLTLNAWDIPLPLVGSADRRIRLEKIADALLVGGYDIVALQEVSRCTMNLCKFDHEPRRNCTVCADLVV